MYLKLPTRLRWPSCQSARAYMYVSSRSVVRPVETRIRHNHAMSAFVADLLDAPLSARNTRAQPSLPDSAEVPCEQDVRIAKAHAVFGSRLATPGERRKAIHEASSLVSGVLVPPKPEEPDNCCMSGCVNCVWDQFRDEFEEWTAKKKEALVMSKTRGESSHGIVSNYDEDMFADIPVGIREFMKIEKKLKQKHLLKEQKELEKKKSRIRPESDE